MKHLPAGFALCLAAGIATAADRWQFESRIAVSGAPSAQVYHHLDGAGRKHIAVSSSSVGVAWEDNRDASPQIYAVSKSMGSADFPDSIRVSDGGEAFEPSIAGLGDGRFVLAWEQDGRVLAAAMDERNIGPRLQLAAAPSGHAGLAVHAGLVFACWRERRDGLWFIRVARLGMAASGALQLESSAPIETGGVETPVQYPSLAVNEAGIVVAWEDRRAGHTRLLFSHAELAAPVFGQAQDLNEYYSARNIYDKGSGVARVSLASFAADEIVAAWMDKRRGGAGYGIFAALGSGALFGPNEKVHGAEGDRQPHYNPATAGNPAGDLVVAWDDFRRGDADIWLSAYDDLAWSEDVSPPPAAGPGEQTSPAVALDASGALHLLWIERAATDAPSRLWYSLGRPR